MSKRLERLQQLTEATAVECGLPIDNERVITIAGLKLHREVLLEQLAAGGALEAGALVSVAKTIAELSPPPAIAPIKFEIVDPWPHHMICPKCSYQAPSKLPDLPPSAGPLAKTEQPKPDTPGRSWLHRADPKPPEPKPVLGYAPYNEGFHQNTAAKNPISERNNFLGGFTNHGGHEFSFRADPSCKPPSGGV